MTLIGIGGYALSGKDAIAAVLEQDGWKRTYMSRTVEKAMLALNPWICEERLTSEPVGHIIRRWTPYREIHAKIGFDASKLIPEVRQFLMALGTEVGRDMLGANVWVDAAFRRVDGWLARGHNVVLTGVRFHNELVALRDRDGLSLWVDRGLAPLSGHASENTLTAGDFDLVIPNLGTLDNLAETVRSCVLT